MKVRKMRLDWSAKLIITKNSILISASGLSFFYYLFILVFFLKFENLKFRNVTIYKFRTICCQIPTGTIVQNPTLITERFLNSESTKESYKTIYM